MDIWSWLVEARERLETQGHGRLAQLLGRLPSATCDDHHAQVDAIYPEALALARGIKAPWLELFVRHWNLQSRILHRYEVRDWIGEAVSLIEFANRPETEGCPQSVCVTQDLVNCYGNLDGPGYVAERLAATEETLARIDAGWACFRCISGEKCDALLDAGRLEEALAFAERQESLMVAAGHRRQHPMGATRVELLIALGRLDEAWALNEVIARRPGTDESQQTHRRLSRAWILALQGRAAAALDALPSFEICVRTQGKYEPWARVATRLAQEGALKNDWVLDGQLRQMHTALARHGVSRRALNIALWRAELAIERRRPEVAAEAADAAAEACKGLRRDLGAQARVAQVRAQIGALPVVSVTLTEADWAQMGEDPEADLWRLKQVLIETPGALRAGLAAARALQATGRILEQIQVLEAVVSHNLDAEDAAMALAQAYLQADRSTDAHALALRAPEGGFFRHWLLAQTTEGGARRRHLEAAEALAPGREDVRLWRAELEASEGHHALALDLFLALSERAEPGHCDWQVLKLGTRLGVWPAVRRSAQRLGFQLSSGEGPIDESWGLCRLEWDTDDGPRRLFGVRSGPVTARVVQFGALGHDCQLFEEVLIGPDALNPGTDPQGRNHTWIYAVEDTLRTGDYWSFVVDGVRPDPGDVESLRTALLSLGCHVEDHTPHDDMVRHPETGTTQPGVSLWVAVPQPVPVSMVYEVVVEGTDPDLTCFPLLAQFAAPERLPEHLLRTRMMRPEDD